MKLTLRRLNNSDGFALPTILLISVVLLSILMASIGAASSSRVALDAQYYNKLASQAAESGVARAKDCLYSSGHTPQWSTKALDRDLRPNTDCRGLTVLSNPYVLGEVSSAVRSHYSIEAPDGSGVGSSLKVVGVVELVRSSPPYDVWRRFEQVITYRIEPPESVACPVGFVTVPGNEDFGTGAGFCVAKYEAKSVGGMAVSQPDGLPHVNISQSQAQAAATAACDTCRLITDNEWLTIAHNLAGVSSNWSGGSAGNGYMFRGHSDSSPGNSLAASNDDSNGYFSTGSSTGDQRRTLTLSNGQIVWDFAGNVQEWTSGSISTNKPGSSGLGWRDWRVVPGYGSLSPDNWPASSVPAASNWDKANQGIGGLYSNSSDSNLRGHVRGGDWSGSTNSGVFALALNNAPGTSSSNIGFRITADPATLAHTTPGPTPPPSSETIFVFNTNAPGCGGTVQLPVSSPATGGTVDWGDGSTQVRSGSLMSHTYSTPGEYTVMYDGPITQTSYLSVNSTNAKCLTRVNQWASGISPTRVNFYSASNLVHVAEPPNTVTDMSSMFYSAVSFNQDIDSWDTSNVTNMSSMFMDARSFNRSLNSWDTSNVTDMSHMFSGVILGSVFNGEIGSWDVSKVTDFSSMFWGTPFDRPIGNWTVSSATNFNQMFYSAGNFNQPLNSWNTSNVTDMHGMFRASSMNHPLNNWNTSKVTDMGMMFDGTPFNQNISAWNVALVTSWNSFRSGSPLTDANTPSKFL